jgi:hypothetical protein
MMRHEEASGILVDIAEGKSVMGVRNKNGA